MFLYSISKGAIAGVVAGALATAGGAAWTVTNAVGPKADKAVTAGADAATSTRSGARAGASTDTGAAGAAANGEVSGSPSAGGSTPIAVGGAGGGISVGVNVPKVSLPPVSTPKLGSVPGDGATVPSVPSAPSPSLPPTPMPSVPTTLPSVSGVTVPTVPSGVSLSREGSYTLVVPGTTAVSKQLCLKGEVNKCQTVSVPALESQEVKVRYSGNASASVPIYSVGRCPGGLGVTVSGITPGTTVTVEARGVKVARTLGATEVAQSASLCDA